MCVCVCACYLQTRWGHPTFPLRCTVLTSVRAWVCVVCMCVYVCGVHVCAIDGRCSEGGMCVCVSQSESSFWLDPLLTPLCLGPKWSAIPRYGAQNAPLDELRPILEV
jgi:hypothetical protein